MRDLKKEDLAEERRPNAQCTDLATGLCTRYWDKARVAMSLVAQVLRAETVLSLNIPLGVKDVKRDENK